MFDGLPDFPATIYQVSEEWNLMIKAFALQDLSKDISSIKDPKVSAPDEDTYI